MNSEKLYIWLQAFSVVISLVYMSVFTDYCSVKETYKHPLICGIFFELFSLGFKIAEYFIIKLFANTLIFIFKLNIDTALSLKIVLISYAIITLIDTIEIIKSRKELKL